MSGLKLLLAVRQDPRRGISEKPTSTYRPGQAKEGQPLSRSLPELRASPSWSQGKPSVAVASNIDTETATDTPIPLEPNGER